MFYVSEVGLYCFYIFGEVPVEILGLSIYSSILLGV